MQLLQDLKPLSCDEAIAPLKFGKYLGTLTYRSALGLVKSTFGCKTTCENVKREKIEMLRRVD